MKDWTGNKVSTIRTGGYANTRQYARPEGDYYATEPKAASLLLDLDEFNNIWECACGGGHLAKVFDEAGKLVRATDKYDRGYRYGSETEIDFLTYEGNWGGDIVTNPPYKYAGDFIEKGMALLHDGRKLALFLPTRYLSSKARRKIFDTYPPYKVWVASGRLACAINGEFERVTSSPMDYAWFVWRKGNTEDPKIGWFN